MTIQENFRKKIIKFFWQIDISRKNGNIKDFKKQKALEYIRNQRLLGKTMEFGKTFLDNFVLDIIGEGDPDYSNFKGEEGEEGPSLIETFIPFIFGIATYFLIIDLPCRIYKMVSKYFITYFNQS